VGHFWCSDTKTRHTNLLTLMHSSVRSDEGLMRRELPLRAIGVLSTRDRRDADGQDCSADETCATRPHSRCAYKECGQTEEAHKRSGEGAGDEWMSP
jgi:hypothetical protein